jgi:septal ring factor EnvC (AmiA/AmiB activator)
MYPSDLVIYGNVALNLKKIIQGASKIFLFLSTVWITSLTSLSLDIPYKKDILSLLEDMKTSMGLDEPEQFGLLEQKIESLISLANSLKKDKISLEKKIQGQGEKIDSLATQIEVLRADRGLVRKRIATLLERIEEFNSSP